MQTQGGWIDPTPQCSLQGSGGHGGQIHDVPARMDLQPALTCCPLPLEAESSQAPGTSTPKPRPSLTLPPSL